ncbi:hypothetical protein AURANDRAFT_72305 [Aureococcus anophagefferens]|uniref:Uncharacterized protein n=1 Tax=Aureococcus anophagefferens TaxID=44056 RepID=F0YI65_AURAN|nr:hypothetical protein AURANDRAFT_72305 [Aureococcus anophagefferens]EGB05219.1 hypothetical protein AURANDRAFT_72305 [Aureococcus anophagefferens]|eukprot:XP_009040120.1 hypothetical protein AURANDRAFT_72305 [Aureococcus anophagefferens]
MNGYFAAGANTMGGRELKDVALLELPLTVDESGAARANAFQMFGGQFISASGRQSGCMIDQVRGVMGLKLAGEAALRMDLVADRASSHPILGEAALMSRPRLIVSLRVRKDSKCIVDGAVIGQVRQRGHFWKAIADYHTSELAEREWGVPYIKLLPPNFRFVIRIAENLAQATTAGTQSSATTTGEEPSNGQPPRGTFRAPRVALGAPREDLFRGS